MKLAVSTYSLWRWRKENNRSLDDALHWIADEGVAAVEFVGLDDLKTPGGPDALRRAKTFRRLCDRLRLAVAGYCCGAEFLCDHAAQRSAIEETMAQVDIAAALGAPTMRHDVTRGQTAKNFPQVLRTVVPAIREIADHAARLNLRTSVENHGFYLQTADRIQKLLNAVNHPNFGFTLDLGNWLCLNQDPVAATARLARRAVMVHAKDFHLKKAADVPTLPPGSPSTGWFTTPAKIALRGAVLGHGVIDVRKQIAILRRARYKGYFSLEFEGIEDPPTAIRLGLAFLRQHLRQ